MRARGPKDYVPGEVVIRVRAELDDGRTNALPLFPPPPAEEAPSRTGISELDDALGRIGAFALYRVFEPGALQDPDAYLVVRFDERLSIDDAIAILSAVRCIADVSPHARVRLHVVPNDPEFPNQWACAVMNCTDAWNTVTGDPNLVIAVIDTGCDFDNRDHPFLLPGRNFLAPGHPPQDEDGHGTHVAGTIAAATNNGVGVAGLVHACQVLPAKVMTQAGTTDGAFVAQALNWAAHEGARVINCSFGSLSNDASIRAAIDDLEGKGVIVVASMGNDGLRLREYPAAYAEGRYWVIAVGAVGNDYRRPSFSNTGSWITVVAPGVDIISTKLGGGVTTKSGTSMAAPHVTGLVGLILASGRFQDPSDIKSLLGRCAIALRDKPADPIPNEAYGAGLVNAQSPFVRVATAFRSLDDDKHLVVSNGYGFAWCGDGDKSIATGSAPAMAIFDNGGGAAVYVGFMASDGSGALSLTSSTVYTNFPPPTTYGNIAMASAPAIAAYAGSLYVAFRKSDDQIWVARSEDGTTFPEVTAVTGAASRSPVTLAAFKGRLYLAFQDANGDALCVTSTSGGDWSRVARYSEHTLGGAPAMTAFEYDHCLYVAFRAHDETHRLHVTFSGNGESFSPARRYEDRLGSDPSIVVADEHLYIGYQAHDDDRYLFVTSTNDGKTFNTPGTGYPRTAIGSAPAMVYVGG